MKYFNNLKLIGVFLILLSNFSRAQGPPPKRPLELDEITIDKLREGYRNNIFTIEEVVKNYIDRIRLIDKNGPELHSVIIINPDALKIAGILDKELKEGKIRGPLHGIPVLLKDNIDTHDKMPTTAGSRALQDSYPLHDSYIAKRLREAGAVILGKANLSEWANFRGEKSISGWSGVGGLGVNPYVLDRSTCGSSSGSAASVSANLTAVAVGTETNGSIVCPSQTNGVVGLKPTVGLVSRSGVIPISYSQDSPGPIARTVKDAAILLGTMTGVDNRDDKTQASKGKSFKDYTQFLKKDGLKGKRIGVITSLMGANQDVDVLYKNAIQVLEDQGAELVQIDSIMSAEVGVLSMKIMVYEFHKGLNDYFKSLGAKSKIKSVADVIAFNKHDSIELKYFGQEYLEMKPVSEKEYREAVKKIQKLSRDKGIDRVMKKYKIDAIIGPTGGPAWKIDLKNGDHFGKVSTSSYAAIAGYPNITVPMGFVGELPVGISFFGAAWSEPVLLQIAYAYEQATHHRRAPGFIKSIGD